MTRRTVWHDDSGNTFDDGPNSLTVFPGAIASVFGRTGTVVAAAGDYFGVVPAALTGATQAARFVGATTSGSPASGTFAVGDVVVARDGHVFVCTVAGSPGTWVDVGAGASVSYATPSIALGSSAAAGAASTVIRSDSTIAAFDATAPTTQAFGDSAAVGTAAFAARRDHKHAMPATPVTSFAKSGGSALTGAVTISEGTGVTLTPSGNDIAIAATGGGGSSDGWNSTAVSLTYSSVDGATGICTTGSDLSGTIPVGARLKFTQTTVKYFIVTAISGTTITFWGGTDYTLVNAAVSSVSWSTAKVPFGFNPDPAKWTVTTADTTDATQASPVNGTWYNLGSIGIVIPIGNWRVYYEMFLDIVRSGIGVTSATATLSTANNSSSDATMDCVMFISSGDNRFIAVAWKERPLVLASKTSYFLNAKVNATGHSNVDFRGDLSATTIRAICAYL